jgi:hypothetical protein
MLMSVVQVHLSPPKIQVSGLASNPSNPQAQRLGGFFVARPVSGHHPGKRKSVIDFG